MSEQHSADAGGMDRRLFLGGAAAAAPLLVAGPGLARGPEQAGEAAKGGGRFPGMITRGKDNLEFPFSSLDRFLTPNEHFYIRTHFDTPEIDVKTWRLRVEGAVQKPFDISYDELRKLPSRTVTALLECSGNGRILLRGPQIGLRWEQGAVSNAEWTGVPLAALLERAGLRDAAVDVVLEGADRGEYREPLPRTPGVIAYARSLPVRKARQPEVLLAYAMNGRPLPRAHGSPVRAIVPGWYGMASVKWLKRILVTEQPFHGYFQTFMYSIWERRGDTPDLVPVTEMEVKAQIARPALYEVVPAGSKYRVFGAAWTGEADVTKVEFSFDGGKRWAEARLLDKQVRHSWRFWDYQWTVPREAGTYTLMARATDSRKRVQPLERDEDRRDAMISHVQRIEVLVQA